MLLIYATASLAGVTAVRQKGNKNEAKIKNNNTFIEPTLGTFACSAKTIIKRVQRGNSK